MKFKNIVPVFLLLFFYCELKAQDTVKPDDYNIFYYENGQKSSEGYLKDSEPDGIWKSYYKTGIIKSEGKYKNNALDSLWIFYDEKGDTLKKITYHNNQKNGYYLIYQTSDESDSANQNKLLSKELYLNDTKEGESYYYYPNGNIWRSVYYKNGKRNGKSMEFSEKGIMISIMHYRENLLVQREFINRTDRKGNKQGVWKEFYKNGKIKQEVTYLNDKYHGLLKTYNERGELEKSVRYFNGQLVLNEANYNNNDIEIKDSIGSNGRVVSKGGFKDNKPVGVHTRFNDEGKPVSSEIFDELGFILAAGSLNTDGYKNGSWEYFYSTGELMSKGQYKNNKKQGMWNYYYQDGKVEQKGSYRNGQPEGLWSWYYPSGILRREEDYYKGMKNGIYIECSIDGDTLVRGEYREDEKDRFWYYNVGDHIEEGNYKYGLRSGEWKYYYPNKTLKFKGKFNSGLEHGKHLYFYPDKSLEREEYYSLGKKEKSWNYYNDEGRVRLTITYKNDEKIRVNGFRLKDK